MYSAIVLVKTRKDKARLVRAALSTKGFRANIVPGNFNILAEIKAKSESEIKDKVEEAKNIDGVTVLETFPAYWGRP